MHTAEDDNIGIGFLGPVGEAQGIADVVRNVLNGTDLVIVGENDSVALFFEAKDVFFEIENGGNCHAERS